jgi:hypothetical protein
MSENMTWAAAVVALVWAVAIIAVVLLLSEVLEFINKVWSTRKGFRVLYAQLLKEQHLADTVELAEQESEFPRALIALMEYADTIGGQRYVPFEEFLPLYQSWRTHGGMFVETQGVLHRKRGVLKRIKVRVFCQRSDGSQVDVFVGEASRDRTLLKYPSDSVKRVFALEKTTEVAPGIAQLTVAEGWLDFCGKPENRHTQLVLNLDV